MGQEVASSSRYVGRVDSYFKSVELNVTLMRHRTVRCLLKKFEIARASHAAGMLNVHSAGITW